MRAGDTSSYQVSRLRVLLGRLLQPPMGSTNSAVALVYEGEDVRLILHLEALEDGVGRVCLLGLVELGLEALRV